MVQCSTENTTGVKSLHRISVVYCRDVACGTHVIKKYHRKYHRKNKLVKTIEVLALTKILCGNSCGTWYHIKYHKNLCYHSYLCGNVPYAHVVMWTASCSIHVVMVLSCGTCYHMKYHRYLCGNVPQAHVVMWIGIHVVMVLSCGTWCYHMKYHRNILPQVLVW